MATSNTTGRDAALGVYGIAETVTVATEDITLEPWETNVEATLQAANITITFPKPATAQNRWCLVRAVDPDSADGEVDFADSTPQANNLTTAGDFVLAFCDGYAWHVINETST